jgi:hypothetical protein
MMTLPDVMAYFGLGVLAVLIGMAFAASILKGGK